MKFKKKSKSYLEKCRPDEGVRKGAGWFSPGTNVSYAGAQPRRP
jgi:hypothetical protein